MKNSKNPAHLTAVAETGRLPIKADPIPSAPRFDIHKQTLTNCRKIGTDSFGDTELYKRRKPMKFTVDQDTCIGCGSCVDTCPEVFELPEEASQVKLTPVPEALQASALEAEDDCPVFAISHTA